MKKIILGFNEELKIVIDGKTVLCIGQTSDEETVNLFFYPHKAGVIYKSMIYEIDSQAECTHEFILERKYLKEKNA